MNKKQIQLLACDELSSTEKRQEEHTYLILQKLRYGFYTLTHLPF